MAGLGSQGLWPSFLLPPVFLNNFVGLGTSRGRTALLFTVSLSEEVTVHENAAAAMSPAEGGGVCGTLLLYVPG